VYNTIFGDDLSETPDAYMLDDLTNEFEAIAAYHSSIMN